MTQQAERARSAEQFLLTRANEHTRATLDGLHYGAATGSLAEDKLQAVVRDGDRSVEVILVRGDDRGYRTLGGRWLGVNGEALSEELLEEVLGATVRLPAKLSELAERDLSPLDGWRDHPWLKRAWRWSWTNRETARSAKYKVRYEMRLGLVVEGGPQWRGPRRKWSPARPGLTPPITLAWRGSPAHAALVSPQAGPTIAQDTATGHPRELSSSGAEGARLNNSKRFHLKEARHLTRFVSQEFLDTANSRISHVRVRPD